MQKIWYGFVKFWVRLAIKLFYRRIEIQGYRDYPVDGPVLLAPNHQNAFMDALIPAVFAPRPVHFLVRADVFKSKFACWFFNSLNMMPVYRQRDGISNLAKNDDVFERCYEILRNEGTLLIFPEAGHLGIRKLRPLSKGFTRIVFGALKDHEHLKIKVVPVGLNYGHYSEAHSRLMLNFGKPIPVDNYKNLFAENPAKAMTALRVEVQEKLEKEIIHVADDKALEPMEIELERILPFYLRRQSGFTQANAQHYFYKNREKKLVELSKNESYMKRIHIYDIEMRKNKLRAPFFFINEKDIGYWAVQFIFLLAVLPLFLLSWLVHLPTYLIIHGILNRYVADKQFHSSIKLVGALVLIPIFMFVFGVVAMMCSIRTSFVILGLLLFFPFSIMVIRELRLPYRYALTKIRMVVLKLRNKDLVKYLKSIEEMILKSIG